jgi:hypothetical protein
VDRHPTPLIHLQWLEEIMQLPINNSLADKIRKYDWQSIDTYGQDFYNYLQWDGKKNFVKGL